jgi:hypothetical protein
LFGSTFGVGQPRPACCGAWPWRRVACAPARQSRRDANGTATGYPRRPRAVPRPVFHGAPCLRTSVQPGVTYRVRQCVRTSCRPTVGRPMRCEARPVVSAGSHIPRRCVPPDRGRPPAVPPVPSAPLPDVLCRCPMHHHVRGTPSHVRGTPSACEQLPPRPLAVPATLLRGSQRACSRRAASAPVRPSPAGEGRLHRRGPVGTPMSVRRHAVGPPVTFGRAGSPWTGTAGPLLPRVVNRPHGVTRFPVSRPVSGPAATRIFGHGHGGGGAARRCGQALHGPG